MQSDQIALRQRLKDDLTPLTEFAVRKLKSLAVRRLGKERAERTTFCSNAADIISVSDDRWRIVGRYECIDDDDGRVDRSWWMVVQLAFGRLNCIDDNRNECFA